MAGAMGNGTEVVGGMIGIGLILEKSQSMAVQFEEFSDSHLILSFCRDGGFEIEEREQGFGAGRRR